MTDNTKKMTLEERIVQTLKDEKLYQLVGDEDTLTELVKRAIHEALWQPQRVDVGGYGRMEQRDSVAVAAARTIADQTAKKLVDTMVTQLLEDQKIRDLVKVAIAAVLPEVLRGSVASGLMSFGQAVQNEAFNNVANAIRDKKI